LAFQSGISFLRVYVTAQFSEKAILSLRKDTFNKVINMPMQFFNERKVGDLNSRISSDVTTIQETISLTVIELLRQLLMIVLGVIVLFFVSTQLTLIMLAVVPVITILAVLFGRYIKGLGKSTQDAVAESNTIVQESLTGIISVKSFANEAFETNRYIKAINEVRKNAMKGAVGRGLLSTFIVFFMFGAIGIVIIQGAELKGTEGFAEANFMAFILLTGIIGGSIAGIAFQFGALQRGIGSIESVMDILDLDTEDVVLNDTKLEEELTGALEFKNVDFNYPSRPEVEVLKKVNFSVKKGEQIALVGPSGSGKSTIISLLQRFYEPTSGEIKFNGKPTSDIGLKELRNQMALVPQEVILFGGTIGENIAYGKPGAGQEEITEAARKANALNFIKQFPEGFDTMVGERGVQLSGGQRQRIAIARAVLKSPEILILDEATSSLDSESERLVQDALDRLMENRTSIIIAHRLSTIRNADKILVLSEGEIKEEGTHEELLAMEDGIYHHLTELQMEV
jgi:ABC-type multidrug transport system fused ATPase/permease subunit